MASISATLKSGARDAGPRIVAREPKHLYVPQSPRAKEGFEESQTDLVKEMFHEMGERGGGGTRAGWGLRAVDLFDGERAGSSCVGWSACLPVAGSPCSLCALCFAGPRYWQRSSARLSPPNLPAAPLLLPGLVGLPPHVSYRWPPPPAPRAGDIGLKPVTVYHNLAPAELYEHALKYEPSTHITSTGAIATLSGAKTGRSPK